MEILGDFTYKNIRVHPCKMLTFWYTWFDGMTYMYKYSYMSASACECMDFSLLSLIVKNQCVCTTEHIYVVIVNEYIVYRIASTLTLFKLYFYSYTHQVTNNACFLFFFRTLDKDKNRTLNLS